MQSKGKWYVGKVVRSNAGGTLYAPCRVVENEVVEHEMTPSHDRATMQREVDRLNGTMRRGLWVDEYVGDRNG